MSQKNELPSPSIPWTIRYLFSSSVCLFDLCVYFRHISLLVSLSLNYRANKNRSIGQRDSTKWQSNEMTEMKETASNNRRTAHCRKTENPNTNQKDQKAKSNVLTLNFTTPPGSKRHMAAAGSSVKLLRPMLYNLR